MGVGVRIIIRIRATISEKNDLTYWNVMFCLEAKKCNIKCQKVANILKISTNTLLFGM